MATVTQNIPTLTGGISQQPDELKLAGQVNVAKNVLPDVTHGLLKRPGSQLIKQISAHTNSSKWFHYYRDEAEQYIGQINLTTGDIKIWRTSTGAECSISYSYATKLKNYLKTTGSSGITSDDVQTLTVNDYTFVTNRNKTVAMSSKIEPLRPPEVFVELKQIKYASQYALNLFDNTTTSTVTTATRINVELLKSSNNYCSDVDQNDSEPNAVDGFMYEHADRINSNNDFMRCTDNAGDGRDSLAPNVGTKIFSVTDGGAQDDKGAVGGIKTGTTSTDTEFTYNIDVKNDNGTPDNASNDIDVSTLTGTSARTPKNLYFRITTIGQSVPSTEGTETTESTVYQARYTTTHDLLHGGEGWITGDYFYVWMKDAYYKVTVESHSTSEVQANLALVRPQPTPFDTKTTITAESILGDLRTEIIANERFLDTDVRQIGNGLYISQPPNATVTNVALVNVAANEFIQSGDLRFTKHGHGFETGHRVQYKVTGGSAVSGLTADNYYYVIKNNSYQFFLATSLVNANNGTRVQSGALSAGITYTLPSGTHTFETGIFNASTPVNDLLNVVSGQVDTVADLPRQCKHGFVVKVSNSADTEDDDHYLKFFGDNDRDGTGVFEECAKPGTLIQFDNETMPIQIVSPSPNNFNVDFVSWEEAAVGDTDPDTGTNPQPTFVGKSISNILFHRNRLCLLSNENVIMSRPGNFFNFWSKTATTFSVEDVIDVSCSSTTPAILYDGIGVNAGLLLFTDNQQFLLSTDSDVLAPNTVKLNSISTYNFNKGTSPISLGTTVGFLDNANKYSRFFEMSNILREGEPIILEQSKIVSNLFNKDLKLISNSRENSVIFFSQENTNQLYGLRYHQSGQERVLQSWFEWQINGNIQYHCMINDTLFVVVKNGNYYQLIKYSIKLDEDGQFINQDDNDYRIHLDLYQNVPASNINYDSTTNKTTFSVPVNSYTGTGTLALYDDGELHNSGLYATGIVETVTNQTTAVYEVTGRFAQSSSCVVGYLYDMEVELPKIYVTQTDGNRRTADTRGSLVLHRAKVNFGPVGLVTTTLKRVGKADYTKVVEQPIADSYKANDAAIEPLVRQTIPIYEKNTNVVLTIKSTHPGPATLYSYNWEGDYTNKLYTRV